MINGSKPAMPITNQDLAQSLELGADGSKGLTKREMFAMYSPVEIPEWYRLSFNADTSMIDKPILSEHEINMMNEYNSYNYGLNYEDFNAGSNASLLMRKYNETVSLESEKQLYFSWRSHYADALLKELEK